MQLSADIDLRPVAAIIRKFPEISKKGIRLPLLAWVGDVGRALAKRLPVCRRAQTLRANLARAAPLPSSRLSVCTRLG